MPTKKVLVILGMLILAAMLLVAVPGQAKSAAGPAAAAETPAVPVVQFESCAGCHEDSGSLHQKYYGYLYQDGVLQVKDVKYTFTAGTSGKLDTTVVTFKMTMDGKPFDGTKVENLNIYYAPYGDKAFTKNPATEAAEGRTALKGKLSYKDGVTTSTLEEKADAKDPAYVDYTDLKKGNGILVVYGYDKQVGSLPARIKQVQFPYAAVLAFGKVDYASAANNDGCEKCHTDPYLKHGNIYGQIGADGKLDFYACKVCHFDDGEGGHFEWQLAVDNPELGGAYAAGAGTDLTDAQKAQYGYKTSLMNDVHMSHAMEFPYPQSMSNCVTCHAGKLDKILSDANFKVSTCKSCHPVTGAVKKNGDAVIYDTTTFALKTIMPATHTFDLDKTDCATCHAEGKGKTFKQIHTGYEKTIYTAAGKKISDIVTVSIDKAAFKDNKLTIDFSAASSEDIGLDVKTITPTVLVGMYGWDTKDFVVGAHERLIDDNKDGVADSKDSRNLEFIIDGKDKNPRFTTVSAADGKWQVTADLTAWADLIKAGTVKRLEIAVMPALNNADKAMVALNAPSKTFDLTTGKFVNFYAPIVDVEKCDACHEALGTTFHTADRGGSVVVCRMCHITKAGGSHLEMQSRSIDSYVHAIHSSQQFDIAGIDFANPIFAEKYALESESPFPKHGITNCEACHNPGTYDVPSQGKSLPGILSASADKLIGKTRNISGVPSYVTGPASRACGACHRAELINQDASKGLATFNQHIVQFGYMVPAGEKPLDTLSGVWDQIMELFK
jgi:OmcA/MtrC family decaheme c-type cytochrome